MESPCIFHVDMDAFFVSVEELLDASLRGKPVVVGAQPGHRGVVAAASYEARKYGIHSAMPVSEAVKRCPHAIFLRGHSELYSQYSNEVYASLSRYSPLVEMVSIDEGYLDMTGSERLFCSPSVAPRPREYSMEAEESAKDPIEPLKGPGFDREALPVRQKQRPRSMALDPRNLLGVSIASDVSRHAPDGRDRFSTEPFAPLSKRKLSLHEFASGVRTNSRSHPGDRSSGPVKPASIQQTVQGNLDSKFLMMSVAQRLRADILEQTGLNASIGIGTSRLVAKVASDLAKPRGIFLVVAGQEAVLLAPLNIRRLPGIGPKTEKQLNALNVVTVGDLQRLRLQFLTEQFGRWGESLALKARGLSDGRFGGDEDPKSISHENTFAVDTVDREEIEATLVYLIQRVGKRLRDHCLFASTIQLKLRDAKFNTVTRATSLAEPTDIDAVILKRGLQLFRENWNGKTPIRLIGLGVSHLGERGPHPKLLEDVPGEKIEKLYQAADFLRNKYGFDVLKSPRGEKPRGDDRKPRD